MRSSHIFIFPRLAVSAHVAHLKCVCVFVRVFVRVCVCVCVFAYACARESIYLLVCILMLCVRVCARERECVFVCIYINISTMMSYSIKNNPIQSMTLS